MLNKERRLTKKEVEETIKKGKSLQSPLLSFKYLINLKGDSRFAFVISSKISKSAVSRNLFKRRCRAIIKKNLDKIKDKGNFIFFAKKGILDRSYRELEGDLVGLLEKSKMLYSL